MSTAFAAYVGDSLKSELFTHIDVGCSGGIDPVWRVFGPRLRAVAFDASLDECERLAREDGIEDLSTLTLDQLEAIWERVKRAE